MIINRKMVMALGEHIATIKQNNIKCPIGTKYKILKLESLMKDEFEICQQILDSLVLKYAKFEDGNIVYKDGNIALEPSTIVEFNEELLEFYKIGFQMSDLYFDLDELEELNLEWADMEVLMPFIKN